MWDWVRDTFGNSQSLKMAGEGWNKSVPGRFLGALGDTPTAQSIASGATLPGDVYAGRQPMGLPSETEDLSRVADMTGLMLKGGSASNMTGQIPKGAIGTFAGPQAKNAPLNNYAKGATLEQKGATPTDIWHDAGVFRDASGLWRHEIPDFGASLKVDAPFQGRLGAALEHPELYKAYPQAQRSEVKLVPGRGEPYGEFSTKDPEFRRMSEATIGIRSPLDKRLPTLLHEVQHGIQGTEGTLAHPAMSVGRGDPKSFREYKRQPVEQEARQVETRYNWSPEKLREIPPWQTPDYLATPIDKIVDRLKSGLLSSQPGRERRWF